MDHLIYTLRQLRKNPGFTTASVLTLTLCIGANLGIFSLVNAILLRRLPYASPERLVQVYESYLPTAARKVPVAPPVFHQWREQTTCFEGLAGRAYRAYLLTGQGEPQGLVAGELSANIFSLLQIRPEMGRDFLPEEEQYGKHRVVLLSHELWRQKFGGDKAIIGRTILLSDESYTVIGVMPPHTRFPDANTQLWTPLAFAADEANNPNSHNYAVFGRLKKGVTLAQARQELTLISARVTPGQRSGNAWAAEVYSLRDELAGDSKTTLLILLASALGVLLIGCANVANLFLGRWVARVREFAIRVSLGATRSNIVAQLLCESTVIVLLGATGGLFVAAVGLPFLTQTSSFGLPGGEQGVRLDGHTVAFTIGISLVAVALLGMLPGAQSAKTAIAHRLGDSSRGSTSGRSRQRVRRTLVAVEVALSLVLLIAAGLVLRSFGRVLSQPLGYNPEDLLSFEIGLPGKKYEGPGAAARFFQEFLDRVRANPGLSSAALVAGLPLAHWDANIGVTIDGAPPPRPEEPAGAQYAQVSPDYFRVMQMLLLQGRTFEAWDDADKPGVAVVNEAFAREFKLGTNALGQRLTLSDGGTHVEVVGIVRDIKMHDLAAPARSQIYRPYRQACWGQMRLIIRTSGDRPGTTRLVRTQLDSMDKDVPILDVQTMSDLLDASVEQRRLAMQLLGGFAVLAVTLAALGLYGVVSFHVGQRTPEIGIRMALGAEKAGVVRLILREGLELVAAGIVAGLMVALFLTGLLRKLLYQVAPTDPLTFVLITLLLLAITLIAAWIPARRAARISPIDALRNE